MGPKPTPKACRWPGCMSLANKIGYGCCDTHQAKWRYQTYGKAHDQKRRAGNRAIKLLAWLNRDRRRWRYGAPPLTPSQQLIKDRELESLCARYLPQTPLELGRYASQAAIWARKGGRRAFNNYASIKAREAGWRRRWLERGEYDPQVFATGKRTVAEKQD